MKAASQARRKPVLEEIEPRILYAADFSPGLLAAAPSLLGVEHRTLDAGGEFATRQQSTQSTPQQQATRHEVVFVDTATPDYQKLVDDIKAQSGGDRRLDVVLLDPNVDGIKQISATLTGMKEVSAVHLIGHGADGQIELGGDTLNFDSLLKNASQIKGWGQALTQDADVLIYGCDVAEHADGKALVEALARLTGADVAASENLTGAADRGGDWILEYQTGGIATALAISTAEQFSYSGTLATFTVTSTSDSGGGSLRTAITNANSAAGADTINFNIGGAGVHTIGLASALPGITGAIVINGASQPGYAGAPLIELKGNGAGANASALTIAAGAAGSTIRGLVISGFDGDSIVLTGGNNLIVGNYIGTNATGSAVAAIPNAEGGIRILNGSNNNTIGGTTALDRNVIAGNGVGSNATDNEISLHGGNNLIIGNYIGVAADGTTVIGNLNDGIDISTGATNNIVGGLNAGEGNLVAGHTGGGVRIQNGATGTLIRGNTIWQNGSGVAISGASTGHLIEQNSIYGNTGLGIDLLNNGVTPNDGAKTAGQPNLLMDFPQIQSAALSGTTLTVSGYVGTAPNDTDFAAARVEIFKSTDAASVNGEGRVYLGYLIADASGNFAGTLTVSGFAVGDRVTATATDGSGNTSEFGVNLAVVAGPILALSGNTVPENSANGTSVGSATVTSDFVSDGQFLGAGAPGSHTTYSAGDTFGSWTVSSGSVDLLGSGWDSSPLGGNSVDLGGGVGGSGQPGTIGQTLATTNGQQYQVTFVLSGQWASGTADRHVRVSFGGSSQDITISKPVGWSMTNFQWAQQTLTFTATSASTALSFRSLDAGGEGPIVSDVAVTGAASGSYTYSLNDNAGGRFAINSTTGGITVANGSLLDYETATSHNITVHATGGAVAIVDEVFTIQVTNTNDAPVLSGANNLTAINEDPVANAGTLVSALISGKVTDQDSVALSGIAVTAVDNTNGAWQYSTNGGSTWTAFGAPSAASARLLAADANSYVRFVPNADWNGTVASGVTFRAWDQTSGAAGSTANTSPNGGSTSYSTATASASITITAVNDTPAGTNNTVTALEDTAYTFASADFGFTDSNDSLANVLSAVKISTIPGAGTLVLSGVAVTAGQTVSAANIAAGNLKFSPAANANGVAYAAFTFQVQDDGGTANGGVDLDQTPNTMTVNVTAVNDAPAGTNKTVTTLEDTAYTFANVDFGFADPGDSPANALSAVKISTIPGAGTLALSGVAVTAGQSITAANIAAGNLKFTPAANANGTAHAAFTFQVQDDGGTLNSGVDLDQSPNTMTIDVTVVNDAPAGTSKTVTTLEDAAYTFASVDFGFTDPSDSSANALSAVKISTIPGAGTLTLSGVAVTAGQSITVANIAAGNLKFAPAANANGVGYAAFTFQVQDDGGTANGGVDLDQSPNTMTVNVTAVNDAPAGTNNTVTTLEDTAYTFTAVDFGFADPIDSPANALSAVKISTIPGAGTLALSGVAVTAGQTVSAANIAAGNLKFTPAANANGAAYAAFTFQVQDDGGTLNSGVDLDQSPNTMTMNITPVNDAPVNTVPAPQGTSEGIPLVFSTGNANQILVGDVDAGSNPVQVTLTATHGVLTLSDVSLVIFGAGDGTADGTMTFTGTLTDINAALNGLTFTPDALYSGAASLTITSDDQGNTGGAVVPLSDSDMVAITVNASTDPTALNDSSYSVDEDNVLNAAAPGVLLNDTSPIFHPLAATLVGGAPLHAASFVLNPDGSFDYTPVADFSGTDSFTYQATDLINSSISNVATVTITVNPVNDSPAGTNNTVTTLEDAAYTFASVDFGFTDPTDSPANALSEVKISGIPGAGTLALSGVAVTAGQSITLANIAAGNLKFTPAANANGVGYAAFTFQAQDDGGILNSGVDLDQSPNIMTIDVTAVNDAPAGTDKTVTAPEDTAYTFLSADFGFSDAADSPANALSAVKITTLPGAGSLANDGVLVSVGGFITAIDIASGKLVFTPMANANAAGYASFTFQVQDDGGTSNGGLDLDQSAKTMTIDLTAVNDAPVLSGSNNLTAIDEDAAVNNGTLVSALIAGQTSDVDAGAQTGIAVTAVDDTNGTWQYTTDSGGTWTAFAAPTAANARLLPSDASTLVRFVPDADWNGTVAAGITFLAWDQTSGIAGSTADTTTNGGISPFSTATASASIAVNAVNDPPTGTDKTVTTLEDTAYTFTAADFGFNDAADSPANALTAVKMATIPGAGSLTDNGVVLSAGDLVSLADIAAGNLKFTPGADANTAGYAAFTFQVQDDGGRSNGGLDLDQSAKTMTIDVTAVNDAPVLSGSNNLTAIDEDAAVNNGTLVSALIAGQTSDMDAGAQTGIAVTAVDDTNGTWQYTTDGGGTWTAFAAPTAANARLLTSDASTLVRFVPDAHWNGTVAAGITFLAWDQTSGVAGSTADTTTSGGISAFSTATASASIAVNAVNDAPVLSGSNNLTAIDEDAAVNNGTLVSALIAGQTSDVDAGAQTGIAVTAVDNTNGTWQYTTDGGGTWTAFAAPTAASALLLTSDIMTLVRFVPSADWNGTVAPGITFLAWDQTSGIAGSTTDTSANGGISAFSAATASASIAVNAVNDAPAGTNNTVSTLQDTAYTFAAVDFGFTDPNDIPADALLAVRITTVPVAGTLTDNGVAVTAGQDVTLSDISTGLLVFTPGANAHAASYASFTFQVQDDGGTANGGVDLDQSPNTMTIDVTVVNDAPVGTDNTITTLEDTAYTFAAVDFGFSDPTSSPANGLLAVEITTLPGAGTLTDNGVAVTAGQLVTAVDIASGKLMFTPMANANGAGYASFTFQVQDDGGIANGGVDLDPIARALDINVTALNDAPAGTDSTVSTLEDSDYVFSASAFGFTDAGDAPTDAFFAVRITSLSSAGSLLLSGAAVSAGQMISVANINAGNLVFSPAPNANGAGYASFTFQVQDNGGTANGAVDTDPTARTLSIDVSAVNDAPVLENNALSVRQGGSVILSGANLSAADADTPATGLIFTLSNVLDGQFELVSGPGVAITSFTQANVTAGQVLFVQDGSANSPAYDVMLSDGTLSVGPRAGSVGFSLVPTGAAGGGLLVAPFVPAAPPAASSNALPPAPAPAPAPVVVTKALPPSAPNAAVVFSGGRVLAAEAPRVELPGAIRAFRGGQSTNVPKAIVNPAPTLQPSEAVMMLLLQAADPTSMQFGPGALREWSAQSAFPVDAHETERDQIKIMMESVEMGGMALSVGVVWWASRVTGLIGSLIASMPAWSQLDPLHIVGRDKEEEELDEAQDPDADADELAVAMVLEGPQARAGA